MKLAVLKLALIAGVVVALAVLPGAAQAPLRFDVASVKPYDGAPQTRRGGYCSGPDTQVTATSFGTGGPVPVSVPAAIPPGTCQFRQTILREIIAAAYGIPRADFRRLIVSGPGWLDADRFDIDAKADGLRRQGELEQMLRTLLAERFGLALHRETRPVDGFALVQAPGGPRMKASELTVARSLLSRVGSVSTPGAPMARLAQVIGGRLGKVVVDETGLAGNYVIELTWAPGDDEQPLIPGAPPDILQQLRQSAAQDGPSLFTALTEQLGLRLEPRRIPLEFLVIDAVERPTAN